MITQHVATQTDDLERGAATEKLKSGIHRLGTLTALLLVFSTAMLWILAFRVYGIARERAPFPVTAPRSLLGVDVVLSPNAKCGVEWLRAWAIEHDDDYAARYFVYRDAMADVDAQQNPDARGVEGLTWMTVDVNASNMHMVFDVHVARLADSAQTVTALVQEELKPDQMRLCIKGAMETGFVQTGLASMCVRKDALWYLRNRI